MAIKAQFPAGVANVTVTLALLTPYLLQFACIYLYTIKCHTVTLCGLQEVRYTPVMHIVNLGVLQGVTHAAKIRDCFLIDKYSL